MFLQLKFAIFVTNRRFFAGSLKFSGLSNIIPLPLHRFSEQTAARRDRLFPLKSGIMARSDLFIDPNPRAGHSFTHRDILFRYVATHRANAVAFYCNTDATKGIPVYPSGRLGNVQRPLPDSYPNCKNKNNANRKQRYLLFRDAFGRHKHIIAAHASYIAEHGELIPEGKTTDHIDSITTNNHPSNLRLLSLSENTRQGHILVGLRNKGINPSFFPLWMRDRYCERMTEFRATHTQYQRKKLTRDDLLQMLVEENYDPQNIMHFCPIIGTTAVLKK